MGRQLGHLGPDSHRNWEGVKVEEATSTVRRALDDCTHASRKDGRLEAVHRRSHSGYPSLSPTLKTPLFRDTERHGEKAAKQDKFSK